jgi:hypothetical protein
MAWAGPQEPPKDPAPPPPPPEPDWAAAARLMEKMPKTVSGLVSLDGKPAPNVRVTDGIDFVTTGLDGRYSITLKGDAMIPYTPSRTVGVCWPTGTWPVRVSPTGRWQWYARLADVQDAANVDFKLVSREVKFPICVAWGTDPHDSFRREFNKSYLNEIIDGAAHITFGVTSGDLDYMQWTSAEDNFSFIEKFLAPVPFMVIHVIGNHDLTGHGRAGDKALHELMGQGPFLKHLGPTRWSFDVGGKHFVAFNWPMIDEPGIAWLEKDLASVPKGTPTYLLIHMWDKFLGPVVQKYPTVKLVLAGHSHRNMYCGKEGEAEFWTKMSLYTYLYVNKDDSYEFVDRCIYEGARNDWDGHWNHHGRGCALYNEEVPKERRGKHVEVQDVTLDAKAQDIQAVEGATYDIRFGAKPAGATPAKRWGLRLTGQDGTVQEFTYDDKAHTVNLMGLTTPFNPAVTPGHGGQAHLLDPKEQEWVEMRIFVMPDRVRVLVNSRLHYQKYITPGQARKIEFFAEDGAAQFGRVDVWQRIWPDYKPRPCANSG